MNGHVLRVGVFTNTVCAMIEWDKYSVKKNWNPTNPIMILNYDFKITLNPVLCFSDRYNLVTEMAFFNLTIKDKILIYSKKEASSKKHSLKSILSQKKKSNNYKSQRRNPNKRLCLCTRENQNQYTFIFFIFRIDS